MNYSFRILIQFKDIKMYIKSASIILKNTVSMFQDNLSIESDPSQKFSLLAVICKNMVNLCQIDEDGNLIDSQQIIPKPPKESTSEAQSFNNIIEVRLLKVSERFILLINTTRGTFFYDGEGTNLLCFQNTKTIHPSLKEETSYYRGACVLRPNVIALGTSAGLILLYEIPTKGTNIEIIQELHDPSLDGGITCLASDNEANFLCCADTSGNVGVWRVKSNKNVKFSFSLTEKNNLCTSMATWKNNLICAYSNGKISLFDLENKTKSLTICAHARYITSLDIMGDKLVSAGEDCYFRVWEFSEVNGKIKVMADHSERIVDGQICGARFHKSSKQICISTFDNSEICVFKYD